MAGKKVKCKKCGNSIVVPGTSDSAAPRQLSSLSQQNEQPGNNESFDELVAAMLFEPAGLPAQERIATKLEHDCPDEPSSTLRDAPCQPPDAFSGGPPAPQEVTPRTSSPPKLGTTTVRKSKKWKAIVVILALVFTTALGVGLFLHNRWASPVNRFKMLLSRVEIGLQSFEQDRWTATKNGPFSYNIVETNSLVSPYMATLTFQLQAAGTKFVISRDFEATYAYQEGKWVLKDTKPISRDLPSGASLSAEELENESIKILVELNDSNLSPQSRQELHLKFDMACALMGERRIVSKTGLWEVLKGERSE